MRRRSGSGIGLPPILLAAVLLASLVMPVAAFAPTGAATAAEARFDNQKTFGRFGRPLASVGNPAAEQLAKATRTSDTGTATTLRTIARYPSANWVGGQSPADAQAFVASITEQAASQRSVAQIVMFDLPNRTCPRDDHFAVTTASSYRAWVRGFVAGLGRHRAIVIVEPDALGLADCLPAGQRLERYALIRYAVREVRAQRSWAYIDVGHSAWLSVRTAVDRLRASGISTASGFSLNSSNFRPDEELIPYGEAISRRVRGRHFVIDSSRNGMPVTDSSWCNPANTGLGHAPALRTNVRKLDAYLWIKNPGGSDGNCNGGPEPGHWFAEYAQMLVANAHLD